MYNILISGYYGFNNIGDESILRTVIDNLREKLPDTDITVLSRDPASTEAKYGVKAAPRMSRTPLRGGASSPICLSSGWPSCWGSGPSSTARASAPSTAPGTAA